MIDSIYKLDNTVTGLYIEIFLPEFNQENNNILIKEGDYPKAISNLILETLKDYSDVSDYIYTNDSQILTHILNYGLNNFSGVRNGIKLKWDNQCQKDEIETFLTDYGVKDLLYNKYRFDTMYQTFKGYSKYKVEGTFRSERIYYENTLVYRIIFLPNLNDLKQEYHITKSDNEINQVIERYLKIDRLRKGKEFSEDEVEIISYLKKWINDVTVFMYTYIVYELCSCLNEMYKHRIIKKLEEEIWITSFWDIAVNKAVLTQSQKDCNGFTV